MEEIKDFKTPEELFDFVLKECSDLDYIFEESVLMLKVKGDTFSGIKILYATQLYERFFHKKLKTLRILIKINDLGDDWVYQLDIQSFNVSGIGLTKLPELPENLISLDCSMNNISVLPELPKNLQLLYCENNKIKELSELPDTLKILWCQKNFLTELPELPNGLKELSCHSNQIDKLYELPKKITKHMYSNNPITSEIEKMGKLKSKLMIKPS